MASDILYNLFQFVLWLQMAPSSYVLILLLVLTVILSSFDSAVLYNSTKFFLAGIQACIHAPLPILAGKDILGVCDDADLHASVFSYINLGILKVAG